MLLFFGWYNIYSYFEKQKLGDRSGTTVKLICPIIGESLVSLNHVVSVPGLIQNKVISVGHFP